MSSLALFVQLVPLALGAAMSPTLMVLQLAILSGDGPVLARAWSLAAGRMLSLVAITVGGTSLLSRLPDFGRGFVASPSAAPILMTGGAVLLVVAVRELRRGARPTHRSAIFRVVDAAPPALFAFGAGWMFVNASTLALYVPAMHIVARAEVGWPVRVLALLLLFALTSAAAVVPPLVLSIAGDRARPALGRMQGWFDRRGHLITVAVTAVFGVALLAYGTWNLLARG